MSKTNKSAPRIQIVVFGESGVGKTCFTDMFLQGSHFIFHSPINPTVRTLTIDSTPHPLKLMDLSSTTLREDTSSTLHTNSMHNFLSSADGIVLLYDITSPPSFQRITNEAYMYLWSSRYCPNWQFPEEPTRKQRFGCVLVGNKKDVVEEDEGKREVDRDMAEQWAESQGFGFFEISSNERGEVETVLEALVGRVERARRRDERDERESEKAGRVLAKGRVGEAKARGEHEDEMGKGSSRDRVERKARMSFRERVRQKLARS